MNDRSISQSLGRPEYSYYFVLKAYRPVLESLGRVHVVDSVGEVDPLFRRLAAEGEERGLDDRRDHGLEGIGLVMGDRK